MKIQHPDNTGKPIEVDEDRADLLKRSGWVEVKPAEKK